MDERKKIIQMISDGKITAEEGAKLLEALGEEVKSSEYPTKLVIKLIEEGADRAKLNIAIPIKIAKFGLSLFTKSGKIDAEIGNSDFDFSQINWNDIVELASAGEKGELFYMEFNNDNRKAYSLTISAQ